MNIIKKMTKDCQRDDCEFYAPSGGVSNSVGHGSTWRCNSCGREWSVWHHTGFDGSRIIYDKNGKDISPAPKAPTVTEIKKAVPA